MTYLGPYVYVCARVNEWVGGEYLHKIREKK